MSEFTLRGAPQPAQLPFFQAKFRHVAYGGSRGGGKSWAMRRKFVMLALRYPGLKLILLRRTLKELRGNHINPLQSELNGFCRYNDDEKVFVFPNGSRLNLGYCDAESDVFQYQGQEFDVIGFEEATHFTQTQVEFMLTCNRGTRADFQSRAYYTSNPGNVGHAWFKRLFVDRQFQGDERPSDYVFFRARLYDNSILMKADPGYERTLLNLPEDLRRAHLDGDWNVFAGQVFKELRHDIQIVDPFPIPAWWRRWISNDPGYNDAATWYWHAADEMGQVFTYRERVIRFESAWVQAEKAIELSKGESIDFLVSGYDATAKRGDSVKSFADHYAEAGLPYPVTPSNDADRSRFSRRMIIHEYLRPYPSAANPAKMTAKVQIFSTCHELVRTLPLLIYDAKDADQIADGDDHAYDGWSYGIQAWHVRRSTSPKAPEYKRGTAGDIMGHKAKIEDGQKRKGVFS